jgi:hypothetical protein
MLHVDRSLASRVRQLRTHRPNELRNYTELAHTMIGRKRLDNIQFCIEEVIKIDDQSVYWRKS